MCGVIGYRARAGDDVLLDLVNGLFQMQHRGHPQVIASRPARHDVGRRDLEPIENLPLRTENEAARAGDRIVGRRRAVQLR